MIPLPLPGNPPTPLVGRERELGILRQHLDATISGHGNLVLIGGEAGIGKTALAETLCREAEEQGALVLVGRCYDLTETPPYGPWVELFGTYAPSADLPALPAGFAAHGAVGAVESQAALFTAVQDFFTTLAAHGPFLLVLDDLHWADLASLDLLRFLTRTVVRLPVFMMVTYRVDELTRRHPLYTLLPVLERESGATRLDLRRLSADAVRALVAARYRLSAADTARLVGYLHVRAEGNAFFSIQLMRALEEGNVIRPNDGGWVVGDLERVQIPLALRQVIDGRLARLGEEMQRLLAVAAIIGHEVSLDVWVTVAQADEDAVFASVERGIQAHLLIEEPDGAQVQFAHALVREAVYEGVPAVRRRRIHQQVGEALAALPDADPDAVVNHFRRAGDSRLVDWLLKAGERALRSSAEASAAARYEEALPLLSTSAPSVARYLALLHLAGLHRYQPEAVGYAADAVQTARMLSDPLLEAVALDRLGTNRTYVESIPEGLKELERAVAMSAAMPDSETHWFTVYSAQFPGVGAFWSSRARGDLTFILAMVGRFTEVDLDTDAREISYNGLNGRLFRDAALGRPEQARAHLRPILAPMRGSGNYRNLGSALAAELRNVLIPYYADDAPEVRRVADTAMAAWEQVGAGALGVPPRCVGLPALILHGEWDEAWSLLPAIRPYTRTAVGEIFGPPGVLIRGRGAGDLAWAMIREMFPVGPATEPGQVSFRRALALQEAAVGLSLDIGDLPGMRAWIEAHDRWLTWNGAVLGQSEGQALWAQYYRYMDDVAKAFEHAERALAHATNPRQPLALLAAHRLLGELHSDAGRYDDAAFHLNTALALADACAAPYERALTLLTLAEMHAARHETSQAQTHVEDVRAISTPLGATPLLARADALAARLAPALSAIPRFPAGLTAREVEVLRLVAAGMTSRVIAERLFLSPVTVNNHIAHILTKTRAANRAEAAAFAQRHALV